MREQVDRRIQTVSLVIIACVAVGFAAWALSRVLIPFVIALFLLEAITPVILFLRHRLRMPKLVASLGAFLIGAGVLGAFVAVGTMSALQSAQSMGDYQAKIAEFIAWLGSFAPDGGDQQATEAWNSMVKELGTLAGNQARTLFNSVTTLLADALIVLLFLIFLLLSEARPSAAGSIRAEVDLRVQRFLVVKFIISLFTGIGVWLIYLILGVPFALAFALLTFLLNFIPNIGSFIALLLPLPLVILDPKLGVWTAGIMVVLTTIVNFTLGSFVEPRMMGRSLGLHPVVILLALLFFGFIWGIVGMFLAAPLAAVIKILCERQAFTQPLAHWMEGRIDGYEDPGPKPEPSEPTGP